MKHTMKKNVLALLLALAMVVSLAACGGGSPEGTYHLTKISAEGLDMDIQQLAQMAGMDVDITLELKSDKTFVLEAGAAGLGESAEGTWSNDNGLTLTAEGASISAKLEGSTIILEQDGTSMTFEKG